MSKMFAKVKVIPLFLGLMYLVTTVVLFFLGPFDWPIDNEGILLFFVFVCMVAIALGFIIGVIKSGRGRPLHSWRFFFRIGCVSSIVLLFPATWIYTGKWPWEVFSVLGDQGLAYREMLAVVEADESGIRGYMAILRALFAPFVYCVVPFAILNFKSLRRLDVLLFSGHLCAVLIFSFMRGTDRETVELLVFFIATLLIATCRLAVKHGRFPFKASSVLVSSVLLIMILCATAVLFVDRKGSRMGGQGGFCVADGVVCSVRSSHESDLSATANFALEMVTGYVSQGYYGLSLALKEDFTSTFGLGHSSFLMSAYGKAIDDSMYQRSYLYKISAAGWSDKSQWSTIYPWLASDVSFPAVPLVIALLGFLWGCGWKSAVLLRSDAGALMFLFLSSAVLYIPANNQLTQTLDSYFAFLFWLVVWLMQGARKERSVIAYK